MLYLDFGLEELIDETRLKASYEYNKAEYETYDYYVSACMYMNNGDLVYIRNSETVEGLDKFYVMWTGGNSATAYKTFEEFSNVAINYHNSGIEFRGYRINNNVIDVYYEVKY